MAPLPPDPYKILGVSKDAQTPEIRSSYRKLVLGCHPDKVQDPKLKEEKQNEFQRVQQAYELLSNEDERAKYDDKVRLEDLRRAMKDKAYISSPRPTTKHSGEFDIRTPEMRSSSFKTSTSPGKVYTFTRVYEDDYATRSPRTFESKGSRSSKRDPSFSERHSKRELERDREREREKEKDRDRRRKEDEVVRRKLEKDARKVEQKNKDKQRDREIKRDAEEKAARQRYAKASIDSFDDELPKSERKRSSKKHSDKGGRTSPRDDMPSSSSRAPPVSLYSPGQHSAYHTAFSYVAATLPPGAPALSRSFSYTTAPAYPAAPSPPPTRGHKKPFVSDETDSDENVRRSSAAPSRRGSGDGARMSRERSSYRRPSNEVLEDHIAASASPAARHTASFSKSATNTPQMGSSPPRDYLSRTNSMPQPVFSRPGPGLTRAHTLGVTGEIPRGRGRSRQHAQAQVESEDSEDSDDQYERERERRHRGRRTESPEAMAAREHVSRYEVESGSRRTRRMPQYAEVDAGHAYYVHAQPIPPIRVTETRMPGAYRETSYGVMPSATRYGSVKTAKYNEVQYSEYPYHRDGVPV